MKNQEKHHQKLEQLLESSINVLQDPRCDPNSSSYELITSVFSQIDLFNKLFSSPLEHEEFVQIARFYLDYEVFPQGTVLMKEKIFADKFFFILRGTAHKTHARSHNQTKSGLSTPKNKLAPENKIHTDSQPNSPFNAEPQQETAVSFKGNSIICPKSPTDRANTEMYPTDLNNQIDTINTTPANFNKSSTRRGGKQQTETSPENLKDNHGTTYITQINFSSFAKKATEHEDVQESPTRRKKRTSGEDIMTATPKAVNDGDLSARQKTDGSNQNSSLKTYYAGDYFGENFHKEHQYKEHGIIAVVSEEIHVLSLTRENYKLIMEELSKRTGEKVRMFSKLFPGFEEPAVHNFSQYFKQKHFKLNDVIYRENDKANGLGILLAGSVNLIREVEIFSQSIHVPSNSSTVGFGPSRRVDVPIASIVKGQFFGEELLMKKSLRQCTAICNTPDTMIYFLDAGFYSIIKTKYAEFFELIKSNALDKFAWRDQKIADFIELQRSEDKHLDSPGLTKGSPWLKDAKVKAGRHYNFNMDSKKIPTETSYTSTREPETPVKIAHLRTSSLGTKTLETYKEKFSRKIQEFSPKINENRSTLQDSGLFSRKNSEKNFKSVLVEFNLRKELEDIKPNPKTKLPRLHIRNKSLQLSNMKRVETEVRFDSLDSSPRGGDLSELDPFKLQSGESSPMGNSTERSHWTPREKEKLKSVIGPGKMYMKGPSGFARLKGLHARRLEAIE